MSIRTNVYVGVYLQVKFYNREICEVIPAYCSAASEHKIQQDANFCPACGAPVIKRATIVSDEEAPLDPYTFFENRRTDMVGSFWTPASSFDAADSNEYVVWLPSDTSSIYGRIVDEDDEDESIDASDIELALSKFEITYADHLRELSEADVSYRVLYGVVPYFH